MRRKRRWLKAHLGNWRWGVGVDAPAFLGFVVFIFGARVWVLDREGAVGLDLLVQLGPGPFARRSHDEGRFGKCLAVS